MLLTYCRMLRMRVDGSVRPTSSQRGLNDSQHCVSTSEVAKPHLAQSQTSKTNATVKTAAIMVRAHTNSFSPCMGS